MRTLIRKFDAFLARVEGVYTYCEGPDCILRLQIASASRELAFSGVEIKPGDPVLMLHFWNEHIPPQPPEGPNLVWSKFMQRAFIKSLKGIAGELKSDPRLSQVCAIGGITVLLNLEGKDGSTSLMRRLGFTILPYHNPLGGFGEFWENFYTWMLIWTYNPNSLRHRRLLQLHRSEIWIPVDEFLQRYSA